MIVKHAIDPESDAERAVTGLDVDVTRALLDRVVHESVDQSHDRPPPRDLREIGELGDLSFEHGEIGLDAVVEIVDHEDVRRGKPALDRGDDLARGRGRHLHAMPGATSDLLEEIQIRRFGRGDGQDAAHQEQWKHPMLPHEVAGQDLHHRRIGDAGEIAGERNTASRGDRLGHVHFADQPTLDQDLAEQAMVVLLLLRPKRVLEVASRDPPSGDQRLTQRRRIAPARSGAGGRSGIRGRVDGHR
jgi:hypothetical protein